MKNSKVIVAVSGGIDSCVLLHMLVNRKLRGWENTSKKDIIVAHVNHGIRDDSLDDEQFVRELAAKYGVGYESVQLNLGKNASEDSARTARYDYLEKIANNYCTDAVLLAHHKQDMVETAALNIVRGTGRSGLSSLKSRNFRVRPLLEMTKKEIRDYAEEHSIEWKEDSTNSSSRYLRNRIRAILDNKVHTEAYEKLEIELQKIKRLNTDLDTQIATILQYNFRKVSVLDRSIFVGLDHELSCEIMRRILIKLNINNIDRNLIENLVIALKVSRPGSSIDIDKNLKALITKRSMRIVNRITGLTHNV